MANKDESNYSSWLIIATTIFLIWGLIFAALRTWTKLKKAFQLNDAFFVSALVGLIVEDELIDSLVICGSSKENECWTNVNHAGPRDSAVN